MGLALADGVTAGLAGLMERGREYAAFGLMEDVREELLDAGIDIHVDVLMRRLRACSLGYGGGYGDGLKMLEEAMQLSAERQVPNGQFLELLLIGEEFGGQAFVSRYWDDIWQMADRRGLVGDPAFVVAAVRMLANIGHESRREGIDDKLHRAWREGGWSGLVGRPAVKLVQMAASNPGWPELRRLATELLLEPGRGELTLEELAPEEVVDVMIFAAETGDGSRLGHMWREVSVWVAAADDGVRVVELLGRLRAFADEYGQEKMFGRHVGGVGGKWMRALYRHSETVPSGWRLLAALEGPAISGDWRVSEAVLRYAPWRWPGNVRTEGLVDWLRRDSAAGKRFIGEVSEAQMDRWIVGLAGPAKERLFTALAIGKSGDSFEVFERHFSVRSIRKVGDGRRWRIVLRRPARVMTVDLRECSVWQMRELRWLVAKLGRDDLVRWLDKECDLSAGAGNETPGRSVWRRLWLRVLGV